MRTEVTRTHTTRTASAHPPDAACGQHQPMFVVVGLHPHSSVGGVPVTTIAARARPGWLAGTALSMDHARTPWATGGQWTEQGAAWAMSAFPAWRTRPGWRDGSTTTAFPARGRT